MSSHSIYNVVAATGSVLPVDTSVGALRERVTIPKGAPVADTVLRFVAVNWALANYKLKYADCLEAPSSMLCSLTVATRSCTIGVIPNALRPRRDGTVAGN